MRSKDGIGCGSKRVSGIDQRSISRSNTDSEPKKKHIISTWPSTRPNQVCSQVIERRKLETIGSSDQARDDCTSHAAPVINAAPPASTAQTRARLAAANDQQKTTRKTRKASSIEAVWAST